MRFRRIRIHSIINQLVQNIAGKGDYEGENDTFDQLIIAQYIEETEKEVEILCEGVSRLEALIGVGKVHDICVNE